MILVFLKKKSIHNNILIDKIFNIDIEIVNKKELYKLIESIDLEY